MRWRPYGGAAGSAEEPAGGEVGDVGTYGKPVAWINASGPAPTGAADAHESLRKVLGFVGADIVEDACVRIPVLRDAIDQDGTIADTTIREQIADMLATLVHHAAAVASR